MEITTLTFAGFVTGVFIVYHLLPQRWKPAWLLATSLGFYATWAWQFVIIFLFLTLVNFWLGKAMGKRERKGLLWVGILLNTAALFFLKYTDYYLPALTRLLENIGLQIGAGGINILLPVGLSFYVVQAIAYLIDVERKRMPAEEDMVNFTLFLTYFPKLVSGPIERARTFIPKLTQPKKVDNELLKRSLSLVVVGLVRKMVVADSVNALIPKDAFTDPATYPGQFLVIWLIAYAFALYNDFAGYTNIARGISGFFGIELSANFMRPYFSRDFTEFWKRWHISLSEWLRDYIFFPTTRALMKMIPNRENLINLILPPMVTMVVSGLWHGVSWHMLVWGGLHGVYQVVERIISLRRPTLPPDQRPRWRQWIAIKVVFVLAVLAWIPFVMDLGTAGEYLKGMVHWADPALRPSFNDMISGVGFEHWVEYQMPDPRLFFLILPALWLDWRQEVRKDEVFFLKWKPVWQAIFLAGAILAILFVSGADNQVPFVYQGF